ncbi:Odorant receptor Or17 [Rhyzopertha dominica]|nr:Odorant receptor Or17 [Rhyzopertha dominica]
MKDDYPTDYFSVNLNLLKWMGIPVKHVNHHPIITALYYVYAITFVITIPILFAITEGAESMLSYNDIDRLTFGMSYFMTHFLGCAKIIMFVIKRSKIRELLEVLEGDSLRPRLERGGEQEITFVKDAIKQANYQAYYIHFFVFFTVGLRGVYGLTATPMHYEVMNEFNETYLEKEIITPYISWIPFSLRKSPNYELAFIYQLMGPYVHGCYIGGTDAVLTGMIIHIKTQFQILKHNLTRITYFESEEDEEAPPPKGPKVTMRRGIETIELYPDHIQEKINERIKNCIRHHHFIMHYAQDVELNLSRLILLQFLCSLSLICFQLYQLSVTTPQSFRFVSMSCYFVLMSSQLFFYCYNGNAAILESESLRDGIYNSDWVRIAEKPKKNLIMMMIQGQRPIIFTAGGFSILSLMSFMAIMRASASCFMFLRQMSD